MQEASRLPRSTGEFVRLSVAEHVWLLELNDPSHFNALSVELVNALGDHLAAAASDDDVRVVVLSNEGNTFCAGADLSGRSTAAPRHSLVSVLDAIVECPKPVVGRVAGHCMGGGVGLAAALDVSVVADDAKIGFTEASHSPSALSLIHI